MLRQNTFTSIVMCVVRTVVVDLRKIVESLTVAFRGQLHKESRIYVKIVESLTVDGVLCLIDENLSEIRGMFVRFAETGYSSQVMVLVQFLRW